MSADPLTVVSPVRVAHVVLGLHTGGLERVVVNLVRGLQGTRFDPLVVVLEDGGEFVAELERFGIPVVVMGGHSGIDWRAVRGLARLLRDRRVKLVHTHNPMPHLYGILAACLARVPARIHTKHGRNYPDNPKRVWLSGQLSRLTGKIVAVSEDVARVAREVEGVPERKIATIRNGIDLRPFAAGRTVEEETSRDQNRPLVIGSAGRFSEDKNYPLLVRAFAKFRKALSVVSCQLSVGEPGLVPGRIDTDQASLSGAHVAGSSPQSPPSSTLPRSHSPTLLLVGDGPDRPSIERTIAECGITGSVLLPGMQEDVLPWLRQMDIFCLSSVTEGTSMTLLEAGAAGLPAVATDVGGNGEVIENEVTGLLVPSGDEEAMSRALGRLAGDPGLRRKMGDAARSRIAERYSVERMVEQYIGVYDEMLPGVKT